jgi:hypothetical protein
MEQSSTKNTAVDHSKAKQRKRSLFLLGGGVSWLAVFLKHVSQNHRTAEFHCTKKSPLHQSINHLRKDTKAQHSLIAMGQQQKMVCVEALKID